MKITVFTSNQPRHQSLINKIGSVCDELFVIQEVATLFPGRVADVYFSSSLHEKYFNKMLEAERKVFGGSDFFGNDKVKILSCKLGDVSLFNLLQIKQALESDLYIVFGASYIKGPLVDFLINKRCLNIHMGVSPYFRGAACNFWAIYKERYDLVGATVHLLSKGLDSGDMLFHALPNSSSGDPFLLGMNAVNSAFDALSYYIENDDDILKCSPVKQNKSDEIFYSKKSDFDESVIEKFFSKNISEEEMEKSLSQRNKSLFVRPWIG